MADYMSNWMAAEEALAELEGRHTTMEAELDAMRSTEATLRAERDRLLDAAERVTRAWLRIPDMTLAPVQLHSGAGLIPAIDALAKLLADEYGRPTRSAPALEDR